LVRLAPDGQVDADFGTGRTNAQEIYNFDLLPNGKIVAAMLVKSLSEKSSELNCAGKACDRTGRFWVEKPSKGLDKA